MLAVHLKIGVIYRSLHSVVLDSRLPKMDLFFVPDLSVTPPRCRRYEFPGKYLGSHVIEVEKPWNSNTAVWTSSNK